MLNKSRYSNSKGTTLDIPAPESMARKEANEAELAPIVNATSPISNVGREEINQYPKGRKYDHCRAVSDVLDDDGPIESKDVHKITTNYREEEIIPEHDTSTIPEETRMSKMGKSMTVTELEALYVEIITRPHPTYRQRVRGTLGNRLKQLRIKAEPKEVN